MTVADSVKAQLDEAKYVMRRQMARIAELEGEVERLKADNISAHSTLKSIYADHNQPTGHRIKAAGLALACETPRLTPEPRPLDLVAEPIVPLAELVEQRRKRQDLLCPQSADQPPPKVLDLLPVRSRGNGSNDHS